MAKQVIGLSGLQYLPSSTASVVVDALRAQLCIGPTKLETHETYEDVQSACFRIAPLPVHVYLAR